MTTFVWKMQRQASKQLGAVRSQFGLEIFCEEETVWIQCEEPDEKLRQAFMQMNVIHYVATEEGQLIERGKRVPSGYVPDGPWIPIAEWISVSLPIAGIEGKLPRVVPIEIVPNEDVEIPQLLRTDIDQWSRYAINAPRVRLDRLAFAMTADGTVYVQGEPLPPIPGKRFTMRGRIAVEAGWTWQPAVSVGVLEAALAMDPGHLAIMDNTGSWMSMPEECFLKATRSSVRSMAEGLGHA